MYIKEEQIVIKKAMNCQSFQTKFTLCREKKSIYYTKFSLNPEATYYLVGP